MGKKILENKFGNLYNTLVEIENLEEPELLSFKSQDKAIELLKKHIVNRSTISLLADIDMDGIGSAYVVYEFLSSLGLSGCIKPVINKDKVHGLSEKHIDYINNKVKPDLFIIVDSSSSDIDIIKQFNCDVLVLDHHKIDYDRVGNISNEHLYNGNTSKGVYYIINNILSDLSPDMSGCQVCYEFFRNMEVNLDLSEKSILKSKLLYQIVGVTLFSDAVKLNNLRNQWYIQSTLCNFEMNITLKTLMNNINKYNKYLTKTFIQFKLVPLFNKAIRAGYSSIALDIFLNKPSKINALSELGIDTIQKEVLNSNSENCSLYGNMVISNLGLTDTSTNYSGVIAQRLVDTFRKSSIAFRLSGDIYKGSFRGLYSLDYNKALVDSGIKCAGHSSAFGIEFTKESFPVIQSVVDKLESDIDNYKEAFISIECSGGEIELTKKEFDDLKSIGGLWDIAKINKNISSYEQLLIKIPKELLELDTDAKVSDKFKVYKFYGIRSISFDSYLTDYVKLYCEYTDGIDIFIRNLY